VGAGGCADQYMIGLAIVIGLTVFVYFATTLDITKADEESQEQGGKTIHLVNIPTPEQKDTGEELKEQWLSEFNQLLKESSNNSEDDTD
jgi:hypothetical protein